MAKLDVVVRGLLHDIGVALHPRGFRSSGAVWRLITPEGVAVIRKQPSQWSRPTAKMFYIDTAVAPKEWWEWMAWRTGQTQPMNMASEIYSIGLMEPRVPCPHPTDSDRERWQVTADTDVDRLHADLLTGVTRAADRLVELLQPGRYLAELSALPNKQIGHWPPLVILLSGRGPSPELDAACAGLRAAFAERPRAAEYVDELIGWAHARASR
ncbi:DUF4304 domain-containing protein [Micromonospora sp. CPCC 205561]|uniref:DUF4304 domain-containing protein n=1 Tax=Micromonospora sp. CPCC 205561 TaxID=3122407 RepID=UPI002FEFD8AC